MKFIKYICKGVLETGKCPYYDPSNCCHGVEHHDQKYKSCCTNSVINLYCNCMPITLEYKMRKAIKEEERK